MKTLILFAALTLTAMGGFAQTADVRRKIDVTGSAEQEVTPDIIYVSVSLREYMDGKNKVGIDGLERQLEKAVTDAGVAKEDFTISNVAAYNSYQKKKNPDFLAAKQYRIKFHDLSTYNIILAQLDPKAIQNTGIDSYDYSKIEDLRRDLKIKALLAARNKATYLLAALGEHAGSPLNIEEINNESFPQPVYRANMMMGKVASAPVDEPSDVDVKKIKLSYQIHAIFEILK